MVASFQDSQTLIENGPDAISIINPNGEILYGSASITAVFGYQPEELVGRDCLELVHPEDRKHSSRALQTVLTAPKDPFQWDARIRHKDGNYSWVESTASSLLLESGVRAIIVHQRDTCARRAAETERQQHAEELAASKLRLEEFAYTAAHDLREPLRAISVFTELLGEKTELDGDARQMMQFIKDGAARMSTLIDNLLAFATTGACEPLQSVDLERVMAEVMQNLTLDTKATAAVVTAGPLPIVRSQQINMLRLFQNLISNALKYRRQAPVEIHVSAEDRGPEWVIRISDNGRGIAPEHQDRVFMPFVRLEHQDVPGSGLGLAVCRKILDGLGGVIWVESEPGVGSTFCFTLPAMPNGSPDA